MLFILIKPTPNSTLQILTDPSPYFVFTSSLGVCVCVCLSVSVSHVLVIKMGIKMETIVIVECSAFLLNLYLWVIDFKIFGSLDQDSQKK